jgi:hypothetical protein
MIEEAFSKLSTYCKEKDYKGWDLFDGLNSDFFLNSRLYRSRLLRLAWIQFFKRSPFNLRKLALVPKGANPKGMALFVSGLIGQGKLDVARTLLDQLEEMSCSGYTGVSWGYNFDWESRAFFVPQGTPNLVTTVFVANAYLDFFDKTGEEKFLQFGKDACKFILENLILSEDDGTLCFRYIPGQNAVVHNAYMLGAALLSRVFLHTDENKYYEKSQKAIKRSIKALKSDFSWPYGERHHHQFVDNFHTGFNLVALKEWMTNTGDYAWKEYLIKAYQYWIETFWLNDGCPKYYNNSLYPIDIHCSAQGIVTCMKLAEYDDRSIPMAGKIANWAIENMQDKKGYFYYQKTRWWTNKIPYIRWSQAWMFYALSLLLAASKGDESADLV